jgi:enamine deaminase RidA (YjgF/YER057c/UK114 family)
VNRRISPASQKSLYDNFHFAPAVVDGQTLRCSGVIGTGADGRVPDDPETQFTRAFEQIADLLKEAGASFADITEITTFHVDLSKHIGTFVKVKDQFVKEPYPAWTAVGTPELAIPGGLVEVRINARLAD